MNNAARFLSVAFLFLVLAIGIATAPTMAQLTTKLSVPQFTVQAADHSYVVPPSTTIDPYTGKEVTTPGYTVVNKTIDVTIKNQPFTSTGNLNYLCYNIRVKGYYEDTWHELRGISGKMNDNSLYRQSGSAYTTILLPEEYNREGRLEVQVKAYNATGHRLFSDTSSFGYWTWEESDWSNTQTLDIPASTIVSPTLTIQPSTSTGLPTGTSNPTETSEDTQLTWLLVGAVVGLGMIVALLAVLLGLMRRRINVLELKQNGT